MAISKKSRNVLAAVLLEYQGRVLALQEALGEAVNEEPDPDENGAAGDGYPEVLDDMEDGDLKEIAKAMGLAQPRQLGRMKRDRLLSLFVDVDDEALSEHIEYGDGAGDDDSEEIKAAIEEAGLDLPQIRELAKDLKALKPAEAKTARMKKAVETIASECSLEDVQEALAEYGDDDSEEIKAAIEEAGLDLPQIRELAKDLKALKPTEAKTARMKKAVETIASECSLEDVQEALAEYGDDDSEEKAEFLAAMSVGDLRKLAGEFGLASPKKLKAIKGRAALTALFEETPLEEIEGMADNDNSEEDDPPAKPKTGRSKPKASRRNVEEDDDDPEWR